MELDDQTLDEILSGRSPYLDQHCDDAAWLMLGNFSHVADDGLERLAAGMRNLEGIELGINQLSPRAAKALLGMNADFLFLTDLRGLDEQAAFVLGACPFDTRPIRQLWLEEPISERAAAWLVGESPPEDGCDRPLSVSVPSITLPVALALSRHTHELYLQVRDESLTPDIAEVLSGHAGYSLTLDCDCGFSDEMLQAEVPPVISAIGNLVESVSEKENGLEEAVFRRANHRLFATGRGRRSDQGTVPAARLQ